jgi:hypothetical protein
MYRIRGSTFSARTVEILWPAAASVMFATAMAMAPAVADDRGDGHQNLGPGCDPHRPAISHKAGGIIANGPPGQRPPIPCAVNTGFRSSEIALVVTNNGALVLEPQFDASGFPIGGGALNE